MENALGTKNFKAEKSKNFISPTTRKEYSLQLGLELHPEGGYGISNSLVYLIFLPIFNQFGFIRRTMVLKDS